MIEDKIITDCSNGSTLNSIGDITAAPAAGPIPGITPINVPYIAPNRHMTKKVGFNSPYNPFKNKSIIIECYCCNI